LRNYEVAYITDPDLDEAAQTALEEKVKGWIDSAGGRVLKVDRWGKRRLAYPIKKRLDGYYFFFQAELPPHASTPLERDLRLSEQILRFMVVLGQEG
jgi:small subunit ribosomal protein S6